MDKATVEKVYTLLELLPLQKRVVLGFNLFTSMSYGQLANVKWSDLAGGVIETPKSLAVFRVGPPEEFSDIPSRRDPHSLYHAFYLGPWLGKQLRDVYLAEVLSLNRSRDVGIGEFIFSRLRKDNTYTKENFYSRLRPYLMGVGLTGTKDLNVIFIGRLLEVLFSYIQEKDFSLARAVGITEELGCLSPFDTIVIALANIFSWPTYTAGVRVCERWASYDLGASYSELPENFYDDFFKAFRNMRPKVYTQILKDPLARFLANYHPILLEEHYDAHYRGQVMSWIPSVVATIPYTKCQE
ncbi:MAG: hypothetical protein QXL94_00615 [Candidatus Parvarchaeum sp.]